MKSLSRIMPVIIGTLLLSACAQYGAPSKENDANEVTKETTAREIHLEADNFYFEPKEITVQKGQEVVMDIEVEKGGHTFDIDELDVHEKLGPTGKKIRFTPQKTGAFRFYCSVSGHRSAGMEGILRVTE